MIDDGFGEMEETESHTAQLFCYLSILRSLGVLDVVDRKSVARFVVMKQKRCGGLAGRVNKKEDMCYFFEHFLHL